MDAIGLWFSHSRAASLASKGCIFVRDIWVQAEQRFISSDEAATEFGLRRRESRGLDLLCHRLAQFNERFQDLRYWRINEEEWLGICHDTGAPSPCIVVQGLGISQGILSDQQQVIILDGSAALFHSSEKTGFLLEGLNPDCTHLAQSADGRCSHVGFLERVWRLQQLMFRVQYAPLKQLKTSPTGFGSANKHDELGISLKRFLLISRIRKTSLSLHLSVIRSTSEARDIYGTKPQQSFWLLFQGTTIWIPWTSRNNTVFNQSVWPE